MAGRLRTTLLRLMLVGLLATAGCQAISGNPGSTPATASNAAAGGANAASHVGEFSGRYQDGLPVYLFPTIYVFGTRAAD